jgi:hypothetical protein
MDYEALARQFGGSVAGPAPAPAATAAAPAAAPAQAPASAPAADMTALAAQFGGQAEPQQPGFFASVAESITGRARATPETQTLPEWTGMPELNQLSVASLKSALGTLVTNPQETVQILQANFPGLQARQDAKGNFILRSSVDQQEYAIPPGFSVGDIPRAIGGLLAFTPAGRATTIPGAVAAGAATQTAIEATQAGTGGRFDTSDVALAGAGGGAGQVVQRTVQAAIPPVKQAVQRVTGRAPAPAAPVAAAPVRAPVPDEGVTVTPATSGQPVTPAAPAAATAAPGVAPVATEAFEEVGELVRKASGSGPGSATAKAKLADLAQVNTEARAAADRLGMDLPFDVFSDNPQVRAAVGLTRSLAGGEAEAAWVNTVRTAIGKADDVVQQFDAAFIEGRPAPGATSQRILDSLNSTRTQLFNDADEIYKRVDATIPKTAAVQFPRLTQTLDDVLAEVGEKGLSAQEKKLYELATDPDVTYGRLLREKNLIGQAIAGKDSPYGNMAAGDLKRLYGALAEDQLTNVGQIGGDALRQELRAANLLTAKKKALENRIVGAFGKEIDGSVATLMQSAIKSAAKGDAAQFNKLMKVVPPELRKETVATALASVASSGRAGQEGAFGFAEFAKTYRGLRANPPVYKQVIEVLGKDADPVLRDLFEISRRITDARAQVLTTGKANQALVEAMKAEGLLGTIMQSTMAQRAVTGAAGLVPGGGLVAPDIVQFMSKGNTEAVKAAGKLFASDEFQKLAIDSATKPEVSQAVLRRAAMSKAFGDFANAAKLPQSLDARVQFLQSAIQTERQFDQENQ